MGHNTCKVKSGLHFWLELDSAFHIIQRTFAGKWVESSGRWQHGEKPATVNLHIQHTLQWHKAGLESGKFPFNVISLHLCCSCYDKEKSLGEKVLLSWVSNEINNNISSVSSEHHVFRQASAGLNRTRNMNCVCGVFASVTEAVITAIQESTNVIGIHVQNCTKKVVNM